MEASFVTQCHTDYKDPTLAYMRAMTVWRNGDRGTWKHLLKAIKEDEGPLVSEDIEAQAKKRDDWTLLKATAFNPTALVSKIEEVCIVCLA